MPADTLTEGGDYQRDLPTAAITVGRDEVKMRIDSQQQVPHTQSSGPSHRHGSTLPPSQGSTLPFSQRSTTLPLSQGSADRSSPAEMITVWDTEVPVRNANEKVSKISAFCQLRKNKILLDYNALLISYGCQDGHEGNIIISIE